MGGLSISCWARGVNRTEDRSKSGSHGATDVLLQDLIALPVLLVIPATTHTFSKFLFGNKLKFLSIER